MLQHQGDAILKLEKEVAKINRRLEPVKNEGCSASSRFKSESSKTCRMKKNSMEKSSRTNIEERTKAINLGKHYVSILELSKRIGDQLDLVKE